MAMLQLIHRPEGSIEQRDVRTDHAQPTADVRCTDMCESLRPIIMVGKEEHTPAGSGDQQGVHVGELVPVRDRDGRHRQAGIPEHDRQTVSPTGGLEYASMHHRAPGRRFLDEIGESFAAMQPQTLGVHRFLSEQTEPIHMTMMCMSDPDRVQRTFAAVDLGPESELPCHLPARLDQMGGIIGSDDAEADWMSDEAGIRMRGDAAVSKATGLGPAAILRDAQDSEACFPRHTTR